MNSANLSSFELILLWASCKIETCSVSCEMVDTCEVIVWVSKVVAFVAVEVFATFWVLVIAVRQVLMELMAVSIVDSESVTDSLSILIFLHLVEIDSAVSISQYRLLASEIAWFNILSLLFHTHSSFGSQYASAAWIRAAGLNHLGTWDVATLPCCLTSSIHLM